MPSEHEPDCFNLWFLRGMVTSHVSQFWLYFVLVISVWTGYCITFGKVIATKKFLYMLALGLPYTGRMSPPLSYVSTCRLLSGDPVYSASCLQVTQWCGKCEKNSCLPDFYSSSFLCSQPEIFLSQTLTIYQIRPSSGQMSKLLIIV